MNFPSNTRCMIFLVFIVFLVASCSLLDDNFEVCNPNGEVFFALVENYEEWLLYFENSPSENSFIFELEDNNCCLIHNYRPISGLLVSTNEGIGPSSTLEGRSGYYYSPNGQPRSSQYAFNFEDIRMNENIFCYRRA